MELNDADDLIKFLKKETNNSYDLDLLHSYKILCRSFPKIVSTLYKKTVHIYSLSITNIIITGCNLFHNLYWYILRYTNNCDVALFIAETGVKSLIEALQTSFESIQENPFKISPNISDAVRYAYKKTIGPLPVQFEYRSEIDVCQSASLVVKVFIVQIMCQIINNDILPIETELSTDTEILIEYIQQKNKQLIHDVWQLMYNIIKNREINDKIYYQINNYVANFSLTEEQKKIKLNTIPERQQQINSLYANVYSLVNTINNFNLDEV